jgi:hypothetical protein
MIPTGREFLRGQRGRLYRGRTKSHGARSGGAERVRSAMLADISRINLLLQPHLSGKGVQSSEEG